MSHMEYCRFENTYNDLQDCYEIIANSNEPLSVSEVKYKQKLIKLCYDVAADFPDVEKKNKMKKSKITVVVRDFDPKIDKFITRKKLSEMSIINSKYMPQQVNDNGILKTWLGIGWIDEKERPGKDIIRVIEG